MSLLAVTSGDIASGVVPAEGVDFDGTYDYLSRSTDLVGNVNSKTFTFSCWVYNSYSLNQANPVGSFQEQFFSFGNYYGLLCSQGSAYTSQFTCGSLIINMPYYVIPVKTWAHIVISIDLTSSIRRYVYINDINVSSLVTWSTYTNADIPFVQSKWTIGDTGLRDGEYRVKGRLQSVFLDYTYRDLSIEANRRLFITADCKPTPTATLKALNPILYLPLKDAATAHINEGTGGNFTANGTFATSNRGANQDNCVASYFDGSADYLSNTTLRASSSNFFTLSLVLNNSASIKRPFHFDRTGVACTDPVIDGSSSATGHEITFRQVDESLAVSCKAPSVQGKTTHISIAFDITNSSSFRMVVNGVAYNTYTTFVQGATIAVSSITNWFIGRGASFFQGNIGELYFDTKYIDLATNNPFWDSVENKPVPVRKVIASTGVTPLIAMPLDASNPGKNYGTGGDFTANSAPYVGARGASEFWARSAKTNTLSNMLINTSNIIPDGKIMTIVYARKDYTDTSLTDCITISDSDGVSNKRFRLMFNGNNDQDGIYGYNSAGTKILEFFAGDNKSPFGSWNVALISFDLTNTSKRKAYYNGVPIPDGQWSVFTNDNLNLNKSISVQSTNADNSLIYLATDYIDFSQEVNRLKFVDAFNMPLDLGKQIDKGIIPKPLIYLPFDDPTNLGKNLGTGGAFSVVGSVVQGSDVNG